MINNIEESYCSFEVSQALKEKGFVPYKLMGYTSTFYYPKTRTILHYGLHGKRNIDSLIYRVPVHIAIEWLRINFGIWINIELTDNTRCFGYFPIIYTMKNREYNDEDMIDQAKFYFLTELGANTPQEATEKALLYALDKLIQ